MASGQLIYDTKKSHSAHDVLRFFTLIDLYVPSTSTSTWIEHWNDDRKPFVCHKTAEEIIAKVRRGRAALATTKANPATRR